MNGAAARPGERPEGPRADGARESLAPTAPATRLGRCEARLRCGVGLKGAAGEAGAGDVSTATRERERASEERSERAPASPSGALEVLTSESSIIYK